LGLSAVPLKHEHFFTADGAFGSRDDTGNQADDGTYRLTNPTTVVISKEFGDVTFHFTADDTTLTLDPIIPDCVKARCFAIQWAVSMAYPGLKWNRTNGRDDRKARQQSTTTPTNAKAATKLFMLASRMLKPGASNRPNGPPRRSETHASAADGLQTGTRTVTPGASAIRSRTAETPCRKVSSSVSQNAASGSTLKMTVLVRSSGAAGGRRARTHEQQRHTCNQRHRPALRTAAAVGSHHSPPGPDGASV
jgi:hypothetical protein